MNNKKSNEIYTKRLFLRRFQVDDFENYYDILKQEEVSRWLGSGKRRTKQDLIITMKNFEKHWVENNYGVWAVRNRENNELIGHCGFDILEDTKETELLYAFDPKSWGKGYATEASMAAIKFLSENFKINYVVALIYPNNNRSSNVIKKIGFEYKGIEKHFGVELLYYKLNLDKYPL
ncbi:GNAT family N-acetyltransferase [Clostridium sporogenes]|uniref:N-acetyltransferase n=1 Tax=Clostridium botulinum TaxID=1491 RepID=A0A6M0T4J0_CLOBO|nr:GNAT family N-acetyltransferase [Clostridium sporogenes]NFA61011.1 N-acetyltransferase [Clostridium botulinum]NFI73606.1 GNAT family N-acetyltransferase [Clostridium sporogenes]NFL72938.1 GNAT family N-acetyltransferase [Clostridium sporogenes]NFM25140.1 GNAT family N-acetyltransferase [Clostridium sporogenes]NFP61146.1 GNAT family N-acetyltransferase [Clostridium sporogenes]